MRTPFRPADIIDEEAIMGASGGKSRCSLERNSFVVVATEILHTESLQLRKLPLLSPSLGCTSSFCFETKQVAVVRGSQVV